MPTVDDLIISLTIKETGKLGQLQKQLEAIVGKKGEKTPSLTLDPETRGMISYIRASVDYLLPGTTSNWKEVAKFRAEGSKMALNIQRIPDQIRDYFISGNKENIDKFKESMGLSQDATIEEIGSEMDVFVRQLQEYAEEISGGFWRDARAQDFIDGMKRVFADLKGDRKESMTLFTLLLDKMGEPQKKWEKIAREMNIISGIQTTMHRLKDDFITVYKGLQSSDSRLKKDIDLWIGKSPRYEKLFMGAKSTMAKLLDVVEEIRKTEDLPKEKGLLEIIRDLPKTIRLEIIKSMLFALKQGGFVETTGPALPAPLWKDLEKELNLTGNLQKLQDWWKSMDVDVLTDLETFMKFIPEKQKEEFKTLIEETGGNLALELKSIIKDPTAALSKIKLEKEVWGKHLVVVAEKMTDKMKQNLKSINVPYLEILVRKAEEIAKIAIPMKKAEEIHKTLGKMMGIIKKGEEEVFFEGLKERLGLPEEFSRGEFGKMMDLLKDVFKKEKGPFYPQKTLLNMIDLEEKSEKMGFNIFNVVDFIAEKLKDVEDVLLHKEIGKLQEKISETLPQTKIIDEFVDALKEAEPKIPLPEALEKLREDITNKELKTKIDDLIKKGEEGYSKEEIIKSLMEIIKNLSKKSTEAEKKTTTSRY